MNVVLTVVIPAYNVENYLNHAVKSLLESKRDENIEILIVDDGSTDSTGKIADNLADKYFCIKTIHQQNGGHGAAINTGIREARGKYFKLLDGDDWVHSVEFARLVDLLSKVEDDLVLCDYSEIYTAERKKRRISYCFPAGETLSMDKWHVDFLISMHSHVFRTELLRKLPKQMDCHSFYVDMEYVLYPLPFVKSFRYETLDVYQYRLERIGQSVSAEGFRKHYKEDENVLFSLICYADQYGSIGEMSEAVSYYMPQRIFDMYYRHILKCIRYLKQEENSIAEYLREFDKKFRELAPQLYCFYRQIDSRKRSLSALQLCLLRLTGFRIWPIIRTKKVILEKWKKRK